MNKDCPVVRDLLPLYAEEMVSPASAAYIQEHLKNCPECTEEYRRLSLPDEQKDNDREAEGAAGTAAEEASALRMLKKKLRRKRILTAAAAVCLTLVLAILILLFRPAVIRYGTSARYSQQDMAAAVALIEENLPEGCHLYSIRYTDDAVCEGARDYCNLLAGGGVHYDECIVFRVSFRAPLFGRQPVLTSFMLYDWIYYLGRTAGGSWKIVTFGV